jgi:hypothetical protein
MMRLANISKPKRVKTTGFMITYAINIMDDMLAIIIESAKKMAN